MQEMKQFTLPNTNTSLEVLMIDNEPWFIAKGVSDALGYAETRNLVKLLNPNQSCKQDDGRLLINESGLYKSIFRSNKSAANRFEDWVTKEVLPSLRKTGIASIKPMSSTEVLHQVTGILVEQETKIKALETKTEEHEAILNRSGAPFGFMSIDKFSSCDDHGLSQAVLKKIAKGYKVESVPYMSKSPEGFDVAATGYHIDKLRVAIKSFIDESIQTSKCYIKHENLGIRALYVK